MFSPGYEKRVPDPPRLASMTQAEPGLQPRVGGPGGGRGGERLAATGNDQLLWVQGRLSNPRRMAGRIPVDIIIDTGAGGGNCISLAF